MSGKIAVHEGSGNVFADVGLENPDEYLAKAQLASQILAAVRRRRLTQAKAGELLGISQPKVSALLNGHLDGFSIERLFRFLNTLGCNVRVTISPAKPRTVGKVEVSDVFGKKVSHAGPIPNRAFEATIKGKKAPPLAVKKATAATTKKAKPAPAS